MPAEKKNDWLTKFVDFLAEAETNRNTIEFAEKIFANFSIVKKFIFNNVYVELGYKTNKNNT